MTLSEQRHDAHHDLTWLVGALARALFERAHDDAAVMAALQGMAGCDFDAPPRTPARELAAACKWLPEAAVAALDVAEEPAMAVAASLQHLRWRAVPGAAQNAAMAQVLGTEGPLVCARAGLALLIAGPGSEVVLPCHADRGNAGNAGQADVVDAGNAVLFVMAGEAAFRDAHGALRHAGAGDALALRGNARVATGREPLLAALLDAA